MSDDNKYFKSLLKYGRYFFLAEYVIVLFLAVGFSGRWLSLYFVTVSNVEIYFNPLLILTLLMLLAIIPILLSILGNIVKSDFLEFVAISIQTILFLLIFLLRIVFINDFVLFFHDISLDILSETILILSVILIVISIGIFRIFTIKTK